uniref:GPN-loop GTPase 2 n=1 Tax=Panagrellus redivivus TaxID=6233 RepID=A0A7E4VE04_PANRE
MFHLPHLDQPGIYERYTYEQCIKVLFKYLDNLKFNIAPDCPYLFDSLDDLAVCNALATNSSSFTKESYLCEVFFRLTLDGFA